MQLSLGLPDPHDQSSLPVLKRVQARVRAKQGTPSRVRLPITADLLRRIRNHLEVSSHPEKRVLWAVCCTAFFGFFRLGELLPESRSAFCPATHLTWGDVAIDDPANPTMIRIHLKRSKTDQFGSGANIFLGRTESELCPVAALLGYILSRGDQQGPFFLDSSSTPLLKAPFINQLRSILIALGVPQDQYAGHSFRIGVATSAALAGIEDSTIQLLGRWQSAAFLQYVRTPPEVLARLSPLLADPRDNTLTAPTAAPAH